MNERSAAPKERGIWLSSDEVHTLRDHIHAIKVAHSLLASGYDHAPDELAEIYKEMARAIQDLSESVLFRSDRGENGSREDDSGAVNQD